VDPLRLTVVAALVDSPPLSTTELGLLAHVSERAVRRHVEALKAIGLVHEHQGEADGLTHGRPASRYALDPSATDALRRLLEVLREPLPVGGG